MNSDSSGVRAILDIEPMKLDVRKSAPNQSGWVAETKCDGYRILAQFGDG